jgi:kynurenine 3-monooxygenase
MTLLDATEGYPNLDLHFGYACQDVDLKTSTSTFTKTNGETVVVESDLVFGTDGAGSAVRHSMFHRSGALRFNFSQEFLDHGYKELSIPASEDGGWRIEKNALHIWPRQEFMLIALPNLDGSFTVTLFLPYNGAPGFDQLTDFNKVKEFFTSTFPSAFEHMHTLEQDFNTNPTGLLGTIKCFPWHAYGKVLLMGDAAHAIVPFYGQGMNCAMEDVVVLDEIIDRHEGDWKTIFETYQSSRKIDTDAIADMAVENYYEMRDHVDNPEFILKRKIEMLLEEQFPGYSSKYNLVTFNEDVPYHEAMARGHAQDDYLLEYCKGKQDLTDIALADLAHRFKP